MKDARFPGTMGQDNTIDEAVADSKNRLPVSAGRLGLLTTWNQHCGLGTYARFLFGQLPDADIRIFAEESSALVRQDEPNVIRCWQRRGPASPIGETYSRLEQVIRGEAIQLLHVNCHARFFHQPAFSSLLNRLRADGIQIVIHLHNLFTKDCDLQALLSSADSIIVHTPENRLEAIANGADPSRVSVLPHGVHSWHMPAGETKNSLQDRLGIRAGNGPLLTTFGFIQPHKGIEGLIEALIHLKGRGIEARGLVVGEVREDDPNSAGYLNALKELASAHKVEANLQFISTYIPDEQVGAYLAASDVVMMNYRSQHYEASGACSLAVGTGAVVMSSIAPPMMSFGDAVWHMTAGYPPGLSAELLLTNEVLREELLCRAEAYAQHNSWPETAKRLRNIYRTLGFELRKGIDHPVKGHPVKENVVTSQATRRPSTRLRVLMQNRPGTFTQRGGDTVVIEKLSEGLRARGIDVTIDVTGSADPGSFDLVHLFNFATPDFTRALAERAKMKGVPFVVTTLCEDVASFHHQSHIVAGQLIEYVQRGQDKAWLEANPVDIATAPRAPKFPNDWLAENAAALFSNGRSETKILTRDYTGTQEVIEVPLGHEIGAVSGPGAFVREYGVEDFVLCVGRIETRKNQLMLLKALEDSELTVVFAAGGFSYQAEYNEAVRSFRRKGTTLVLDRLSPEMLSSAYAACRMHVLPSWFELPGLVSLEAGAHGKNVVATRTGTSADYLRNQAFYCLPWDADSIYSAVTAAYYAPVMPGLRELACGYTWERSVEATISAYERVVGRERIIPEAIATEAVDTITAGTMATSQPAKQPAVSMPTPVYDVSSEITEFQELLERGEMAAKTMDFDIAHELLERAEHMEPQSVRVLKARGAIFLAQSEIEKAQAYFDRAMSIAPTDPKVLSGRGMCDVLRNSPRTAIQFFKRALENSPDHLVAIHQMIDCAYKLESFDDLYVALQRYLSLKPADNEMRFCFAGCLYAMHKFAEALMQVEMILTADETHEAALELREQIKSKGAVEVKEMTWEESEQEEDAEFSLDRPESRSEDRRSEQHLPEPHPREQRQAVFGGAVQTSLEDLSKRITEWRIGGQDDSRETQVVVDPYAPMPGMNVTAPTSGQEHIPSHIPTVSVFEQRFMEIEDLKRERKFDEASQKLEQLLSAPGLAGIDHAKAKSIEAELMVVNGDLVGADMLYDLILREQPEYPRALVGKGALAAEEERWEEAEEYFNRALAIDENYDVGLAGKGLCEMAAGNNETAFDLFANAARNNPENVRAVLGVLQLGYPLGKHSEIEEILRLYLEIHPASIDMLYSLAGSLYSQQRFGEALTELEKILLFEPENSRARELKELISQGQSEVSTF